MQRAIFEVPKMDCPSEEKLIRLALQDEAQISFLKFDLGQRKLTVFHESEPAKILAKLAPLNFGAALSGNVELSEVEENLALLEKSKSEGNEKSEASVLKVLLAINASMFIFEIIFGFVAQSTGLIADAMDMFADAAVYTVSLYAVGKGIQLQRKAARTSGYLQLFLAVFAFSEVLRRFFLGSEPESSFMMGVSFIALIANVLCLILISRHREGGVHMKASFIFSANDVIANLGVILAGVMVYFFKSPYPDLIIGLVIAAVVFRGALAILRISKAGA